MAEDRKSSLRSSKQNVMVVIPARPDLDRTKPKAMAAPARREIRPKPSRAKVVFDIPSSPTTEDSETDEELDWTITSKSRHPGSPTPSSSKRLKTHHPSSSPPPKILRKLKPSLPRASAPRQKPAKKPVKSSPAMPLLPKSKARPAAPLALTDVKTLRGMDTIMEEQSE
ncbi:hypothetical protein PTTG_04633 [Puccinia triticina 1-1 BBBD Race 1]|uniref:Uncharacterized protein n=2 Tax=Puccinia triticina TaxID=208348 RepID=A0A0C4EV01_PUCT1|nr:uncharacterized protein PtA15_10A85 [Puccinia triticina]OAV95457.1 hypothetical protein PTTG_04633 [Puccinia triticina 1-1 BBBD Race 1]WAQ88666.1 hypothetical protein PtA15_10A85 [Puccinia triticina]WAR58743.1 hypothetical protein PtB15_10B82 [Puccinia triticina]